MRAEEGAAGRRQVLKSPALGRAFHAGDADQPRVLKPIQLESMRQGLSIILARGDTGFAQTFRVVVPGRGVRDRGGF